MPPKPSQDDEEEGAEAADSAASYDPVAWRLDPPYGLFRLRLVSKVLRAIDLVHKL